MPFNKPKLKADIKTLLTEMRTRTENADDEFATRLSDMFDEYAKTGKPVYESGLIAPNGGGPVTGTFIGYLE
ncbi:MAG: hypothetical protein JJE55_08290 [Flavobacteriaceae bacterium]|nr:hypothetical protein [Flavobacteriaceae bacterium]